MSPDTINILGVPLHSTTLEFAAAHVVRSAINGTGGWVITPNLDILLDNNKSGALLSWEYFCPSEPVPNLIAYISDSDLWQFKNYNTKAFMQYLRSQPKTFSGWAKIALETQTPLGHEASITKGMAILDFFQQQLSEILASQVAPLHILHWNSGEVENRSFIGLAANASGTFTSELGAALAAESGTFGAVWFQKPDGRVKVSLRSNGEYSVEALAALFGGGGHKNSASFYTTISTIQSWLRIPA